MRSLTLPLTTAQQAAIGYPYMEIVVGADTYTTELTNASRIMYVFQYEELFGGRTIVRLSDYDGALKSKSYEGKTIQVMWSYNRYSIADFPSPSMIVKTQREIGEPGHQILELECVSKWDLLASTLLIQSSDCYKIIGTCTDTSKFVVGEQVIQAVSGATGRVVYANDASSTAGDEYLIVIRTTGTFDTNTITGQTSAATLTSPTSVTATKGRLAYGSSDIGITARISMLTSGAGLGTTTLVTDDPSYSMAKTPFMAFNADTSAREAIFAMLNSTQCYMRPTNTTGFLVTYANPASAAVYSFNGTHNSYKNLKEQSVIIPNRVFVVDRMPSSEGAATYAGSAYDPVSYAALGNKYYDDIVVVPGVTSVADCNEAAANIIAQRVAQAYKGAVVTPMECGIEIFDMVSATDPVTNITATGRVGRIERLFDAENGKYESTFQLGSFMASAGEMEGGGPAGTAKDINDFEPDVEPQSSASWPPPWISVPDPIIPATVDIDFTSDSNDDISWAAGTIKCADGTVLNIDASSLVLANANPYYLYTTHPSGTTLSNTQTFGNAIGGNKVLVAFAKKATEADEKAMVVGGIYGKNPIITADMIFVTHLSAITADMGLLTAGEIRVGTGTLTTDFTGWRLWVDANIGRIAGYSNDVLQWYTDTNGKFYAGNTYVFIDADGMHIVYDGTDATTLSFDWLWSGTLYEVGYIYPAGSTNNVEVGRMNILGHPNVIIGTSKESGWTTYGGIALCAGTIDPTKLESKTLYLGAYTHIKMFSYEGGVNGSIVISNDSGASVPSGGGINIDSSGILTLDAGGDLNLISVNYIYMQDDAYSHNIYPNQDSTYDLGNNNADPMWYNNLYCNNIYYNGGSLPDDLDDLAIVRAIKLKADNTIDMSELPDYLRHDKTKYTKSTTDNINYRYNRVKDALTDSLRKVELMLEQFPNDPLLHAEKVKLVNKLDLAKTKKQQDMGAIDSGYGKFAGKAISMNKMLALAIGSIRQIGTTLDSIDARLKALEA